jgi:hypothetical protein
MSYVIVDVESDGLIPAEFSMVCFGAVIFDDLLDKTFYGRTRPISDRFEPEALAVSGFTRAEHLSFEEPKTVMETFAAWLEEHTEGRPVFVSDIPMGGTDCALPMVWAARNKMNVSAFITYTDSETWAGNIHPAQALRQYRDGSVGDAKAVIVGMTSNGFTLADPNDGGMLDVAGFDTTVPAVIADFVRE